MRKITFIGMLALLMLSIVPTQSKATSESAPKEVVATAAQVERANVITARLNEIKMMDKSSMSASEKKALRKEVRAMKKESSEGGGGIYLSIGAIIIIILLLILLL
jgi:hypothetical protein